MDLQHSGGGVRGLVAAQLDAVETLVDGGKVADGFRRRHWERGVFGHGGRLGVVVAIVCQAPIVVELLAPYGNRRGRAAIRIVPLNALGCQIRQMFAHASCPGG